MILGSPHCRIPDPARDPGLDARPPLWLLSHQAVYRWLRFWHVENLIPGPLTQLVPKVANRPAALPRALEPEQVAAMLSGCERDSRAGQRDLAILTLLARMGLHAGEVAGLQLDDIDWRRAEITIRGKGSRRDRRHTGA